MELIIVTIIIGIMAAFAIPSYQKAVEKSYERTAYLNLMTVHAAQTIHKAKTGTWLSGSGIAEINAALGLNIPDSAENEFHYQCTGDEFWLACVARRMPVWESWEVTFANYLTCYPPCCSPESTGECPSLETCVGEDGYGGGCYP